MSGFLVLGFLIGMAHALEADHLAAVGAIATSDKGGSRKALALKGAAWGLGHTLTLFVVCASVILFGLTLTDQASAAMEFSVGIMLVILGLDVLRRMRARRIHFHAHQHDGGKAHLHAHSHAGETIDHEQSMHDHRHASGLPLKSLAVGLVHGAAGSAGLLALTLAATQDPMSALGYVALFGIGSVAGMAALSYAAAWPLKAAERHAKRLHQIVTMTAGMTAMVIGALVMMETGPVAWGGA